MYPAAKDFRAEVEAVVEELTEISQRLMRAIARSLGLEGTGLDDCFHPWPNIQYRVARSLLPTCHSTLDEYI
jgi:isopenicillin N synthase-like dioxygenase